MKDKHYYYRLLHVFKLQTRTYSYKNLYHYVFFHCASRLDFLPWPSCPLPLLASLPRVFLSANSLASNSYGYWLCMDDSAAVVDETCQFAIRFSHFLVSYPTQQPGLCSALLTMGGFSDCDFFPVFLMISVVFCSDGVRNSPVTCASAGVVSLAQLHTIPHQMS